MTHFFDAANLPSLLWPLALCAAAWCIMVWALRQRDSISEVVNGLVSPRISAEATASDTLDAEAAERAVDTWRRSS